MNDNFNNYNIQNNNINNNQNFSQQSINNNNNNMFPDNNPKKNNKLGLIIVITLIVAIIIVIIVTLIPKENNKTSNDNNQNNNTNTEVVPQNEWKKYSDIKKYEFSNLEVTNLNDIVVDMNKITFISDNNAKGTLDFSSRVFTPGYLEKNGFNGFIYMRLIDEAQVELYKSTEESDPSTFNDILKDDMKIVFYSANEDNAYANCIVYAYNNYWNLGVNIESRSIEEAETEFKKLISLITTYDETAPTVEEFSEELVKKLEFIPKNISFKNADIIGNGFTFGKAYNSNDIKLVSFGSSFYNSYFSAILNDTKMSISYYAHNKIKDTLEVKELTINNSDVRLYRESYISNYNEQSYYYYVGIVYEKTEYVYQIYGNTNEEEIISLLNMIIIN